MSKWNIYLNFPGNTLEAFTFYKSVFGGEFSSFFRYKDMPMEGMKVPPKDEDKILHIALPVGKDDIFMASDALESMGQKLVQGNNVYIALQTETKAEADRMFKVLSAGGVVQMPMADMPWGDYYGNFRDKFGVQWMLSYTYPKAK